MANAAEICSITADGQTYDIWESVEIHHAVSSASGNIDHALMTVSEISTGGSGFNNLKLTVGDLVQMSLAGISVINGFVYLRQAAYDDKTHAVQIGVSSKTQAVVRNTVQVKPGSYPDQTIQQIGSAVFGKVGVGFNVVGSPSGSDLKFVRACEQAGESCFNFVERLSRMVNLHMMDDGKGNISAFRGPQGNVSSLLQEGVNILRGRLLLQVDDQVETYVAVSQDSNPTSGPAGAQNMATATATSPGKSMGGMVKFVVEDASNISMLPHRVNHQVNYDAMKTIDGMITVQGWFAPDGDIWWNKVRQTITVNSPMLIPENSMQFIIKEVVHRQSSAEGTTTDILITNKAGLGGHEGYGQAANPQNYNGPA
jgi:prophage tail gpP-like protein